MKLASGDNMATSFESTLNRRSFVAAGAAMLGGAAFDANAQAARPIRMAVPQAPWYGSFEKLTGIYEKVNATKVEFDVSPAAGLLEKTRNAVRSSESPYDVFCINAPFISEFYTGGFVEPLARINPKFQLQSEVLSYDNSIRWDAAKRTFDAKGDVMAIPVNGNIQLLYYRADLYAAKGLKPPATWEDLAANARVLNEGGVAGFGFRGNRGFLENSFDFYPVLASFGADIFKSPSQGDYTVTVNSPEALKALQFWARLGKESCPPSLGSLTQARLIQLMTSGKLAQAMIVTAAWPQMDDPQRSSVAGKVNVAPLPAGPSGKSVTTLGHWIAAIPKNLPPERKKAALAYLDWMQQKTSQQQYRDVGAVPIRQDVLLADAGADPKYRLLPAVAASSKNTRMMLVHPAAAEISDPMELQINKVLIGEITPQAALNQLARDIESVMVRARTKTGRLPDLR
jgi:multiple sugar transport system substrate-binding protein